MKNMLSRLKMEEKGQAFLLALILLAVGGLIIIPLLGFMGTGLMAGRLIEQKVNETYAADAGIEFGIQQLLNNDAFLPTAVGTSYTYFDIDPAGINKKVVNVTVKLIEDQGLFIGTLLEDKGAGADPLNYYDTVVDQIGVGRYDITITYTGSLGQQKIQGVGAWFLGEYDYVPGTESGMTDEYPIFTPPPPEGIPYRGGTAFIWSWANPNRPTFDKGDVVPQVKTFGFTFEPTTAPSLYVGWLYAQQQAIGIATSGLVIGQWQITATAGGTTMIAYMTSGGEGIDMEVDILNWEINP